MIHDVLMNDMSYPPTLLLFSYVAHKKAAHNKEHKDKDRTNDNKHASYS